MKNLGSVQARGGKTKVLKGGSSRRPVTAGRKAKTKPYNLVGLTGWWRRQDKDCITEGKNREKENQLSGRRRQHILKITKRDTETGG